jgi:hypothetical protein
MEYTQLSPLEIRDLINRYQSELRKLHFQTLKTQATINELEHYAAEAEQAFAIEEAKIQELPAASVTPAAAPSSKEAAPAAEPPKRKRKPGRPKGSANKKKKTSKRGPGRPPKAKKETQAATKPAKRGPKERLSEWDNFVIDSLKGKKQALTTSDFAAIAVKDSSIKSGEAQIKVKLNRTLHKLANKKKMIAKVPHSGRGFAYALTNWLGSDGNLPSKYERK